MEITINPVWIVIVLLVIVVLMLIKKIMNLDHKLKRLNTPVVEQRIAQSIYALNSAHETLVNDLAEISNIKEESEEYFKRVKYILDHSGWTAIRLQNLTNAIKEIGEGQDTHVTFELEADNPNPNAPGESKKSESSGAEEKNQTDEKTDEEIIKKPKHLVANVFRIFWIYFIISFLLGVAVGSFIHKFIS